VKVIVVGSGPAGVSVTKGLLERGCKVTLLDVGNTLETDKQVLLDTIQKSDALPHIESLRYPANAKNKMKLPYGSNFIYAGVKEYFSWDVQNCYFSPSFAQGGLSNVWGGAIAEYTQDDLSNWPVSCRDLSSYYSDIISWLGKYYISDTSSVLSQQAHYLKNVWQKHFVEFEKKGFSFGQATLAIDFNQCRLCGSCQYGCPYQLIYNTSIHLDLLKLNADFNYINDVVVENFSEDKNEVVVHIKNKKNFQLDKVYADRLFVACGAGLSSLLYLRALNKPGKELYLKDSQHFILPCLLDKPFKGVESEALHVLCQLKASLTEENVSSFPVYLQFYTYMDLYLQEMKNKLRWVFPLVKPFLNSWIRRLVVIQGYLNSKESNQLAIQYQSANKFKIKKSQSKSTSTTIRKVVRYLKKHKNELALKPLHFLLMQSLTGQSNHVTGSLPMSDHPQEDEVDIWGRPRHFNRVHFVDGSILPSMPAGPITLTIMANAYRIGKEGPL